MRCTNSYMLGAVVAIPLLAMVLDVRAQQQLPGLTYAANNHPDLFRPWTCDAIPLMEFPSPPAPEPVSQFVPQPAAIPPVLGLNFAGAQFEDSGYHPPDSMGAVGLNHFMEVINGNVSIFRKSDGTRIASQSLISFFDHEGAEAVYTVDPRVLFDQHSGRWIVIAIEGQFGRTIAVAVSQNDDPTGSFCKTSFVAHAELYPSEWPDFPTLGVDANGIYIGANMIGNSGSTVWAIEKGPLIVDPPSWGWVTAWRQLPGLTSQPAHTYGTPGSEFIIALQQGSPPPPALRLYRVDPPLSSPTMRTWIIPVQPFGYPPNDPPALDSSLSIGPASKQVMMSVYRDGFLWTTHSIAVSGRWGIRWYQIDPPGATAEPVPDPVKQSGNVGHSSLHFFMPSLMVNRAGHVALAFSGSDASTYVGAYYTGRRASDPESVMAVPQLLKAGEGPYIGHKWGDYSYSTLDPVDESTIWTIQEYALAPAGSPPGSRWGTWIAALGPFGICNDDNGNSPLGNSPLVCVDWDGADPPGLDEDFRIDTISDPENPNATLNPNITFRTGNDGWMVWSQASRTDATQANLGHIKIDPDAGLTDNFSVTVAHAALPGAANVASIALVKTGWTGESNLPAGRIAGDLTGDLVVQGTSGQSGAANFTIGGNVSGNLAIPTVDNLTVNGSVSNVATITLGGFSGNRRVDINGEFAGHLLLPNGIPHGASVETHGGFPTSASVQIGGVMNGNFCAAELSASSPLPNNVTIDCGIGHDGTICGQEPGCPSGDIDSNLAWPPHGTKDARQPYPMGQEGTPVSLSARQGIGSPNPDAREEDRIRMTLNNSGLRAINHDCWALCETGTEPVDSGTPPLSENKISCVAEPVIGGSEYEIRLERPISTGQWTTLRYAPGSTRVIYASLPGNISGDTRTNSIDLIRRIDCMNGQTSQCGSTVWTQDLDHSGEFAVGLDYGITFVDLWNGAGNFLPWQQTQLPANTCIGGSGGGGGGGGICPSAPCGGEDPGPMSMAMGGLGEGFEESSLESELSEFVEDENAIFSEWVIGFLAGASPQDEQAEQIFEESIDLIVQWCLANFSNDEKAALANGLSDPGISFASSAGQNAAAIVLENITP